MFVALRFIKSKNFALSSNEQLKNYIVENREDKDALRAYVERRNTQDFPVIANVRDIDFEDKLQTALIEKLGNPATN